MKKILIIGVTTLLVAIEGFYIYCRNFAYNDNYLQLVKVCAFFWVLLLCAVGLRTTLHYTTLHYHYTTAR